MKGKRDLFSIVICFKYFLCDDDFISFVNETKLCLNNLSSKLSTISVDIILEKMGFPKEDAKTGQKDWGEILNVSK